MSLQSMGSGRIENNFSDMSISGGGGGGFGSGSGFGLSTDIESFSTKSKGLCLFVCMNSTKMPHFLLVGDGVDVWYMLKFVWVTYKYML